MEFWLKDYGYWVEEEAGSFLQPGTSYSLHWAIDADNGKFKGMYREGIATAGNPAEGGFSADLQIIAYINLTS